MTKRGGKEPMVRNLVPPGRWSDPQIAAKRLPITTELDRSPPTSIPTKSLFLAGFVVS
jgi:hypothetical protein